MDVGKVVISNTINKKASNFESSNDLTDEFKSVLKDFISLETQSKNTIDGKALKSEENKKSQINNELDMTKLLAMLNLLNILETNNNSINLNLDISDNRIYDLIKDYNISFINNQDMIEILNRISEDIDFEQFDNLSNKEDLKDSNLAMILGKDIKMDLNYLSKDSDTINFVEIKTHSNNSDELLYNGNSKQLNIEFKDELNSLLNSENIKTNPSNEKQEKLYTKTQNEINITNLTIKENNDFEIKAESKNFETIKTMLVQTQKPKIEGETQSISIKLKPDSLGELKIDLKLENGELKAFLVVQNDSAKNLILNRLEELSASLLKHEITITKFDVKVDSSMMNFDLSKDQSNLGHESNSRNNKDKHFWNKNIQKEITPLDYSSSLNLSKAGISILA